MVWQSVHVWWMWLIGLQHQRHGHGPQRPDERDEPDGHESEHVHRGGGAELRWGRSGGGQRKVVQQPERDGQVAMAGGWVLVRLPPC